MNKREISEIKKLFKKGTESSFTRLAGCYVHGEDRNISKFTTSFQSLPEEDMNKYIGIFRKSMSGKINKTLFPVEIKKEGRDCQELLMRLVKSDLKDELAVEEFYNYILERYENAENFLILLIHNVYDVPGKANDESFMEDSSEEIYRYINCVVCPVTLSDPGLAYQESNEYFSSAERDWMVHMPELGFLFPSFSDRSANIHETLYYSSNPKKLNEEFVEKVFGSSLPLPADQQKDSFCEIIERIMDDKVDYKTACAIEDTLTQFVTERIEEKDDPSEGFLDKAALKDILEDASGMTFSDNEYDEIFEDVMETKTELFAGNITDTKTFEIKTDATTIKTDTKLTSAPEIRIIDGRKYILVPVEGELLVNGIRVNS